MGLHHILCDDAQKLETRARAMTFEKVVTIGRRKVMMNQRQTRKANGAIDNRRGWSPCSVSGLRGATPEAVTFDRNE
jgi:hypothetical protein